MDSSNGALAWLVFVVLAGLEGPLQALLAHVAATADLLGLLDLEDRGTRVADREEELGVLVEAGGTVAPIHGWGIPLSFYVRASQGWQGLRRCRRVVVARRWACRS